MQNAAITADADLDQARAHGGFHDLLIASLPGLRQQAMALTRNRAEADDLVQTSVASALGAQASFMAGTNFNAWISRILRNRFISNWRSRRETVDIADAPPAILARSGGQEEGLAMRELRIMLGRLPADQRIALLMISVQGLSYEEAAAQLGVPAGTVKARVSRARATLRVWLLGEKSSLAKPAARDTVAAAKGVGASRPRRRSAEAEPGLHAG
jgi:RNA polymerase sigma-70 factor (ECF subfamily)